VIVVGGQGFHRCAVGQGIGVTVLGNAPIVDANTGTWLQVSRSDWDWRNSFGSGAGLLGSKVGPNSKASLELGKGCFQMGAGKYKASVAWGVLGT